MLGGSNDPGKTPTPLTSPAGLVREGVGRACHVAVSPEDLGPVAHIAAQEVALLSPGWRTEDIVECDSDVVRQAGAARGVHQGDHVVCAHLGASLVLEKEGCLTRAIGGAGRSCSDG